MKDRLIQFLSAENISQSQFADSIGVARASISHILSGRNKPGYDFIENTMRHYPALNIEWLLTGNGRMYKTTSDRLPQLLDIPFSTDTAISPDPPRETDKSSEEKRITKIIVCYSDNTFTEIQ